MRAATQLIALWYTTHARAADATAHTLLILDTAQSRGSADRV